MQINELEEQVGLVQAIAIVFIVPTFLERNFSKIISQKFKELIFAMLYYFSKA